MDASITKKSIIIVGAGLCGTRLHERLQPVAQVTVVEKSKALGGRIASRRYPAPHGESSSGAQGEVSINHGGHRFLAREIEDHEWLVRLREHPWIERSTVSHEYQFLGPATASFKHYWEPYRSQLELNWKATRLERQGEKWLMGSDLGKTLLADAVVFTSPVPQSFELARNYLDPNELRALERVRYLKRILAVNADLSIEYFSDEDSEKYFDLSDDELKKLRPQAIDIKKWRYETLAQGMMAKHRYLKSETPGLWFAGDAFVGYSRPETWGIPTALLSADAVADAIADESLKP